MPAFSRQMAFRLGELPRGLRPMVPYPASQPFDAPGWLFEGIWGGLRVLAFVMQGQVTLHTGATSREKWFRIEGLSAEEARGRLRGALR